MRGIVEGFYGTPWTWPQREEIGSALAGAGMDTYVFAPKSDPLHRDRWREPYDGPALAQFERFAAEGPVRLGYGIAPGLSMDPGSAVDRDALLAKVGQLVAVGVDLVGLLLDDLDPAAGLGTAHGELANWLRAELDGSVELFMVPLHYTGTEQVPYLDDLAATVPAEVEIGWTGPLVVNRTITTEDARRWSEAMGGRRPLLWDNTPVNDLVMSHHLFTGPLRGRDAGLPAELSGYLANPMVQARASLPALLSAAAWLRGDDPEAAWHEALGGHRSLMEGCDGRRVGGLADRALSGDAAALGELEQWCAEAESCEPGDLGEDVRPWADQLRSEAAVARVAIQVLRAEREEARRLAPLLLIMWPAVTASPSEVLGGRGSVVPALGQDRDSRWIAHRDAFVAPTSVTDRLVAAAFARLV